ncbi:DUF397 domain-containing protein [Streptomyces chartreusis]|uniref:DUF397 domain-containing protein n=1 Tax=Streptomyces chartreusis TaxID=1969 RepID=UPI00364856ED
MAQKQLRQRHGGECLEVAAGHEVVTVRDFKNTLGPQLTLSAAAWRGFIRTLTHDEAEPN